MSNLKIDIIYYKTSSDFEMEFNLSGCCRMRIFKDKVDTPRGLVNALARDVARSKIIILVTDLFGENCGIPVLAKAVSLPLIAPDKEEFGIKTFEEIHIPDTAVPLVTKTGIYGGCIIESGPQSIIIVSGVRSLRHEIMKAYVHNYVFDVGQLLAYRERMGQNSPESLPPINLPTQPPVEPSVDEVLTPETTDETISDISSETTVVENPSPEIHAKHEVVSETSTDAFAEEILKEVVQTTSSKSETPEASDESKNTETSEHPVTAHTDESVVSPLEAAIQIEIKNREAQKQSQHDAKTPAKRPVQPGISAVDELDFDKKEADALYKKSKKRKKTSNIVLLIVVILLLLCLGVLAYFFVYMPLIGADNGLSNGNSFVDFITSLFS